MNILPIDNLIENDLVSLNSVTAFEGLSAIFTTVPFLKRREPLASFANNPSMHILDDRINEWYLESLCNATGIVYDGFETGAQVHGTNITIAENAARQHNQSTDGIIVSGSGNSAGVFVADCQPIILWYPGSGAAAILHAGWRGTVSGIVGAAAMMLVDLFSASPLGIYAFLGPTISATNYEVGEEVIEASNKLFRDTNVIAERDGKIYFDITRANNIALNNALVPEENIYTSDACTYSRPDLFYSYRLQGGNSGRFMAAITIK